MIEEDILKTLACKLVRVLLLEITNLTKFNELLILNLMWKTHENTTNHMGLMWISWSYLRKLILRIISQKIKNISKKYSIDH